LNEINDLTNNLSNSTRKMTQSDLKANNSDEDEDSEISSLYVKNLKTRSRFKKKLKSFFN
jgi:hypothetical protein